MYKLIHYEGADVQVTDDTADDLVGRGLATLICVVPDVPGSVADVPGVITTGFAVPVDAGSAGSGWTPDEPEIVPELRPAPVRRGRRS